VAGAIAIAAAMYARAEARRSRCLRPA